MAVAAEVLVLVALVVNSIQSEFQLKGEGDSIFLQIEVNATTCIISRFNDTGKKLVWNSSDLWSDPSVIHVRKESVDGKEEVVAAYRKDNATHSDSGVYQSQCFTEGNVTWNKNYTVLLCHSQNEIKSIIGLKGKPLELSCDDASSDQNVDWFYKRLDTEYWKNVNDETSDGSMVVKNKSLLLSDPKQSDPLIYVCFTITHQECVSHQSYFLGIMPGFIYRSEGEMLEENCSDSDPTGPFVWSWSKTQLEDPAQHNSTLMFPVLTLNHSDNYICRKGEDQVKSFYLLVCPRFDAPAVVYFTEGQNVTLRCRDSGEQDGFIFWFIKSNKTNGKVLYLNEYLQQPTPVSDVNFVITNVSLEDTGEYWCVIDVNNNCTFSMKTLLMYNDPALVPYITRSVLLCLCLITMLVSAVVVTWRNRICKQPAVYVNQQQMSHLFSD